MVEEYPKEELQKIYKDLPDDLREALFSQKMASAISDVCTSNGIENSEVVSKLVGYTLLGLLPPDEFEKALADELKLNQDVAKNIAKELTDVVFYPLKESLEVLYGVKIEKRTAEAKHPKKAEKDAYLEPIE